MATTRRPGKITIRSTDQSEATTTDTPTEKQPAPEIVEAAQPAAPRRGPRPTYDVKKLEDLGRKAVELYNGGASIGEAVKKLKTSRSTLMKGWQLIGVTPPKQGVRAADFVLTIPDEPPAPTAPAAPRPPRQASSRRPAAPNPARGAQVTVEVPLESLIQANRQIVIEILLADLSPRDQELARVLLA